MFASGSVNHFGAMTVSANIRRKPSSASASAVRPARTGGKQRGAEIGNALYSTGPLLIFVLAGLLVVAAVGLLALHPTSWMLLLAIAIHVAASAVVFGVAMALLDED